MNRPGIALLAAMLSATLAKPSAGAPRRSLKHCAREPWERNNALP